MKQEFQERNVSEVLDGQVISSNVLSRTSERVVVGWYDPLAQSFLVEDETGVYLTKCDVFFRSKDDMDIPCVFQLRTMENGFPTQHILPFSEQVLKPEDIETSSDGSVALPLNLVHLFIVNPEKSMQLLWHQTQRNIVFIFQELGSKIFLHKHLSRTSLT